MGFFANQKIMDKNVIEENKNYGQLLSKIKDKTAVVGIIGLGYVGLPLAMAVIQTGGFDAIGFDVNLDRIKMLNQGVSDIGAVTSEQLNETVVSGKFKSTDDFSLLEKADIILICVPTPLSVNRVPDLSYVMDSGEKIGQALRVGQLIVLESTTYPKTTDSELTPLLEKLSGLKVGHDFFTAYSPEREDPGRVTHTTKTIPKVVGADDPASRALAESFYNEFIVETVMVQNSATAEAVKLTENIFRAVNIALVNELKIVYDAMGINVWDVIDAASTKPFGFMPFYPGPGIGGHCIPLDPFYLTYKSHEYGRHTRFIELAGEINSQMPEYVVGRIGNALNDLGKPMKNAKVLVMGVAYKKDVADVRESPALHIMEQLLSTGVDLSYHDPYIAQIPKMRNHPSLQGLQSVDINEAYLASVDLAVIITDHSDINYERITKSVPSIVDTRNVTRKFREQYSNIILA